MPSPLAVAGVIAAIIVGGFIFVMLILLAWGYRDFQRDPQYFISEFFTPSSLRYLQQMLRQEEKELRVARARSRNMQRDETAGPAPR